MTPEQVEAHGKLVALLRPPTVRKLVALLRPLSVHERTTILALAIHEGTMTRVRADQVLFALALDDNPVTRAAFALSQRQAQRNAIAILNEPLTTRAQQAQHAAARQARAAGAAHGIKPMVTNGTDVIKAAADLSASRSSSFP